MLCAERASIYLGRALVTVAYTCAFVAYAGMLEISCCTGSVNKVSSNGSGSHIRLGPGILFPILHISRTQHVSPEAERPECYTRQTYHLDMHVCVTTGERRCTCECIYSLHLVSVFDHSSARVHYCSVAYNLNL
jgi:hypothetical protein